MPKVKDGVDVTKGKPPKVEEDKTGEVVPSTEVEVIEGDGYYELTIDAMVATLHQKDETIRRLHAGQEMMEENRDLWQGRAERAEAALRSFVGEAQAKLQEILPNGG